MTVKKIARYGDLIEKYENPIEHVCMMRPGRVFIRNGRERPKDLCPSAWDTVSPFVTALACGWESFYDGRMKDPGSAMISRSDGSRPVSFLSEALDEEAE